MKCKIYTQIFIHIFFIFLNVYDSSLNYLTLSSELFGRGEKSNLLPGNRALPFYFLTRCWLGKPHSNHISLNRPRVWDSPHFLIEKIE